MFYRVIGIMSGSSLDGLDIAFVEFEETGGKWSYEIKAAQCKPYDEEWRDNLANATSLPAYEYLLLHTAYGRYIGEQVNQFIEEHELHHKVQLIASHGHTTFHVPQLGMTGQLGDGATIAAVTEINVVNDLRSLDVAFGGQGAPIVPIGEKLLFAEYDYCLNIGGIANLSYKGTGEYVAFDVCAANRVLNALAQAEGKEYDSGGEIAASGSVIEDLLNELSGLSYYQEPYPKSLANSFGLEEVLPIISKGQLSTADRLRTYVEHVAIQVTNAVRSVGGNGKMMITGGGSFNSFLVERIREYLDACHVEVVVPEEMVVNYKEALIMALIGVMRWREEYNVLSSVTGARRSSIGGAVWVGQEG